MKTVDEIKKCILYKKLAERKELDTEQLFSRMDWLVEVPEDRLRELGFGELEGVADNYVLIKDIGWIYECSEFLQQQLEKTGGLQLKLKEWEMEMVDAVKPRNRTIECYEGGRVNVRAVRNAIRRNIPLNQVKCYLRTQQEKRQYKGCMINTALPWQLSEDYNKIVRLLKEVTPSRDGLYFIKYFTSGLNAYDNKKLCVLYPIEHQSHRPNKELAKIFCPHFIRIAVLMVGIAIYGDISNLNIYKVKNKDNIRNLCMGESTCF